MVGIKLMLLGIAFILTSNVVNDFYILIFLISGLVLTLIGLLFKDQKSK